MIYHDLARLPPPPFSPILTPIGLRLLEVRDMPADGCEVWIAKPSITNQGLSVCVFNRLTTLERCVRDAEDIREWVLQRYVHPPLLLHGRKFHLRAYALCVGSIAVYVYNEVLVLLAGAGVCKFVKGGAGGDGGWGLLVYLLWFQQTQTVLSDRTNTCGSIDFREQWYQESDTCDACAVCSESQCLWKLE